MHTVSTYKQNVNAQNPPQNHLPKSPPELVASFGRYLRSKGVAVEVADAACQWVERFRAFRAQPTTARPMAEAIEQFQAHLGSSDGASAATLAEADLAIERFLAWWRQLKTSATSASPQMRPCRQGASTLERDPSLPLDEPVGLLGRVRREIRVRHYSYRTEQTYLHWIGRYLRFLAGQDVVSGATTGFRRFLEHLAVERRVSAATQNQAFNALLFLYRDGFNPRNGVPSVACRRARSLATRCISVMRVRMTSPWSFSTSFTCSPAPMALSRRLMVSSARSVSSVLKTCWCAQLLRMVMAEAAKATCRRPRSRGQSSGSF